MSNSRELEGGVVVEDLAEGDGQECPEGATVTVHYHGTLEDGTVFDSTRGRSPITFPLDNLIEGWKIGIPGMKTGGTRKLTVPYQLAYGEAGHGPIPPKATLVFEIELVDLA